MHNSLHHLDSAGITPDSVMQIGRRMFEATLDLMPDEELSALPKLEHLLMQSRQEGEASILMRQLQRRFGSVPEWAQAVISEADSKSLEEWTLRFVDAQSLNEMFADRV